MFRRAFWMALIVAVAVPGWSQDIEKTTLPESFEGRWVFQALNPTGSSISILIVEVTSDNGVVKAEIVSTSAPYEMTVKSLEIEDGTFTLVAKAGDSELVFTGAPEPAITGTIKGAPFDGASFLAQRTELETLERPAPPGYEGSSDLTKAMRIKDQEERLQALEKVVQTYPDSRVVGRANLEIFRILLEQQAEDERLGAAVEASIETAPRKPGALSSVARSLGEEGRLLEEAEAYAREALDSLNRTPTRARYLDTLGWVLYQRGQLEEAADLLAEALDIRPDDANIAFRRASVLEEQGRETDARELYLRAYVSGGRLQAKEKLEASYEREHRSLDGLHELIDAEYAKKPAPFDPGKYQGERNERIILAELFTGADCGPCTAADYAFDGLLEHYPAQVLAVLEYHVHIPRPDPMANPDTVERAKYYGVRSVPYAFFAGTEARRGGGNASRAERVFGEYKDLIGRQLGKEPAVRLEADAVLEDGIVRVSVRTELEETLATDNLRLRVALVEGSVHYTGITGVHLHRKVVRKMLGGAEGVSLEADERGIARFEATQDLMELESDLEQHMRELQEERDIELTELTCKINRDDLSLVAFVQNDDSKEILNAIAVPIRND